MGIFDRLVWFSFTVLFFSYDGDRYDRGCVISIHHAIQIGFYIPAAETISITTDFKMAPATSMPILKWLEETKFSEDITDTILALTILTKNAKKEFFIERIKVKENNEVRIIIYFAETGKMSVKKSVNRNFRHESWPWKVTKRHHATTVSDMMLKCSQMFCK